MTVRKRRADKSVPYSESETHTPNPMHQSGVVDTTGITGAEGARVENISPLFGRARAEALAHAVDVLDNDPGAAEGMVVFPDSDRTRDEAEARLRERAEAARQEYPAPEDEDSDLA